MYRTDADGNVAGQFTDGDPAVPTPATVLDSAFLNEIQEELCNLIEGAGVTLAKGVRTQLEYAVRNSETRVFITVDSGESNALWAQRSASAGDTNGAIHAEALGGGHALVAQTSVGATGHGIQASAAGSGAGIRASNGGTGVAGSFFRGGSRGALCIEPVAGDPSAPQDGDIWYDSTSGTFRARVGGVTKTFTLT